ncbi:MAG: hypothetical protein IPN36_17455 [Bacteroidetes bacterium]|nr:hypothetical protein [Bacteroidota bacterium]
MFYCGSPMFTNGFANHFDYTLGYVINKNHQIMDSGDSLIGLLWYQEMIIVPDPANSHRFYIFCAAPSNLNHGLYYSIVDLSFNGGLGKVVQKNIQIRNDTMCDGITATRHGNGRWWW